MDSSGERLSKTKHAEFVACLLAPICTPYLDSKDRRSLAVALTSSSGRMYDPSGSLLGPSGSSLQLSIGSLSSLDISNGSFCKLLTSFRATETSSYEGQNEDLSTHECENAVVIWSRDDDCSSSKSQIPASNSTAQVLPQPDSILYESESADVRPIKRHLAHRESGVPAKRPNPPSKRRNLKWSTDEDIRLQEGVRLYKVPNWKKISKHVGTRTNKMCAQRWYCTLRPEVRLMKKGRWTKEEDDKLRQILLKEDEKNERAWNRASEAMGFSRNILQCRERWNNFLDPSLRFEPWTAEEDALLLRLQAEFGNKWKQFAREPELAGRSTERIRRRFKLLTKINVRNKHITRESRKECT